MNQQQPQHSHCGHFNSPLSTSMHQSDQLNDIQIEETQDIQTPHSDSQNLMILVDDLRKFRVGFTAEDKSDNYIRSIDFSPDGMVALCNTENAIRFYTLNPKLPTELILTTGKYGAGIAKFFNDSSKVVHTSTKVDFGLRLSDHNSKSYERYFLGHSAEVTSLVLAKSSHNVFASASKDKSVKIWDSRQSSCVHSKSTKSHPITEFHSEDTQLAVATAVDETTFLIEFIDIRNVKDENVVSKFYLTDQDFEWTDMTFSNNGKFLMINTVDTLSIVIDPATGDMLHRLSGKNRKSLTI